MFTIALRRSAVAITIILAAPPAARAQAAAQTATFTVNAINQIAVTGSPSMTITTAVSGSAPTSVTNVSATWSVTTNQSTAKITASIPTIMPAGLTLLVSLAAPAGATSTAFQPLGTTAVDLVTGVTKVAQGPLAVTYQLNATVVAGVVTSATRLVTYTITGGV